MMRRSLALLSLVLAVPLFGLHCTPCPQPPDECAVPADCPATSGCRSECQAVDTLCDGQILTHHVCTCEGADAGVCWVCGPVFDSGDPRCAVSEYVRGALLDCLCTGPCAAACETGGVCDPTLPGCETCATSNCSAEVAACSQGQAVPLPRAP